MSAALTFVLVWLVAFAVISEPIHMAIFGRLLSQKTLNRFFDKHFDNYKNGHKSSHILHGDFMNDLPFAARSQSILSKWYLNDYGTIPRWSPWSKRLDALLPEHSLDNL